MFKQKKPDTKEYKLYDSFHIQMWAKLYGYKN